MNKHGKALATRARGGVVAAVLLSGINILLTAQAADIDGASDHPIISRYEGSEIINYNQDAFNEFALFTHNVARSGGAEMNAESTLPLEGRVTTTTYRNPAERTTLEVFRNYDKALTQAG
jgi:hypothetical protein